MNEELIMVPYRPDRLNYDMFLQKVRNGILLDEYRMVTEQDIEIYPKMGFEWVPVEPYIIDDKEGLIDDEYAFLIGGRWAVGDFDSFLGAGIKKVRLVVRRPEEIDPNVVKKILKINYES